MSNLDTIKSKYDVWPECDCHVHQGFEWAANSVKDEVIKNVSALKEKYPDAKIKTTGHSLGAALA